MNTRVYKILTGFWATTIVLGGGLIYALITRDFEVLALVAVILYIGSILTRFMLVVSLKMNKAYLLAIQTSEDFLSAEQITKLKAELIKSMLPLKVTVKPPIIDV